MMLKEIIEKCNKLNICEKRCITDKYNELIFYSKEIAEWSRVLAEIFGPAIKPALAKPTEDDLRLTESYGGIYDNQTLFKKDFGEVTLIAMFWPWRDDIHTTLKIAVLEK